MNTKQDFKYYVKRSSGIARLYFSKYNTILKQFEFEDIEQHVRIGIWEAYKRYTPERGKFFSYASWWINASVKDYIMSNCDVYSLYNRIKRGILQPNFFTQAIVEKIESNKPIGKNIPIDFSSFFECENEPERNCFRSDFNRFLNTVTCNNESYIDNKIDLSNVKIALKKLINKGILNEVQVRRFLSIFVYKTTMNSFSHKIDNNVLVSECRKIIKLIKGELNVCTKKK